MKHLQAESLIEYEKVHKDKSDDVELFANDPYLHGNYSYQYTKDIIDADEHEQTLLFPRMSEIEDYCRIHTVWELFSHLVVVHSNESKINAKQILRAHFIETQNQKPEFVFNLIILYLQE
jgi:hypothetical protein